MDKQPVYFYHEDRFDLYDFGPTHPFAPVRQRLTFDLLQRASLIEPDHVIAPPPLDDATLGLFHTEEYIQTVQQLSDRPDLATASPAQFGLGSADNPAFSGMHEAAKVRVAATVDAVEQVMTGRAVHAANFSGGLHHALPAKAAGFCIYNDIGVALAWLRKKWDCRIAYIDVDAHHGDGVQWGFYRDPQVLTVSIHESGRTLFPGTGFVDEIGEGDGKGYSINIPLLAGTDGKSWSDCFHTVLPEVLRAFRPDIIVSQHGCDAHWLDPLSHLAVSVQTLADAAGAIHEWAHELCDGRWVALGGGGYAVWTVVPRSWALVWSLFVDQHPSGPLPQDWIAHWQEHAPVGTKLPTHWLDRLEDAPRADWTDEDPDFRRDDNVKTANTARQVALSYLAKSP